MNWYDSLVSWADEHGILVGSFTAFIVTVLKYIKIKGFADAVVLGLLASLLVPMVFYTLIAIFPNISPSLGLALGAGIGSFGADTIRSMIYQYVQDKLNNK